MMELFSREARSVVSQAREEARRASDRSVEAEHILLACTVPGASREQLAAGLEAEEQQALSSVGISRTDFDLVPRPPAKKAPPFGTSAKQALEHGLKSAVGLGDRRIREKHLLLGILTAADSRAVRALRAAGVDPEALAASLRAG
jgi:ATP-dependent Clp protease ATP-binding subunit ClpA